MEAVTSERQPRLPVVVVWQRLPPALRSFVSIVSILTIILLISIPVFHFIFHNMQRTEVFSVRTDRFGDIWNYRVLFFSLHTQAFFESANRFAYPAPCAIFYDFLYKFGRNAHKVYILVFLATLSGSAYLFFRMLRGFEWSRQAAGYFAGFLVLTSYPWEKLFDRSNLEIFLYIFIALGFWAFITGREELAAVLWGCAGAMKIYPFLLCAVFFRKQSLRALFLCVFTFIAVLFLSFWWVGPTVQAAALGSLHGLTGFLDSYGGVVQLSRLTIDHSLLSAIKEICLVGDSSLQRSFLHGSTMYQAAVVVIGPILYFRFVRRMPVWNQLCLFLVCIVLLPPVSYDYTLIHFYLVFWVITVAYLTALQQGRELQHARLFYVMSALLMTSQGWIQVWVFRLNGLIKASALVALFVLLVKVPLTLGAERDALVGATAESQ